MNLFSRILVLTSLLFFHAAGPAQAGTETNNCADAIEVGGEMYLLDFFQAGIHLKPYINRHVSPSSEIRTLVKEALGPTFEGSIPEEIYLKFTEIEQVDAFLAWQLLTGMKLFQWNLVDFDMIDIKRKYVLVKNPNLKPLAIRSDQTILINLKNWNRLDGANRAGTVLHEILYAFASMENTIFEGVATQLQDGGKTQTLNSFLFSTRFSTDNDNNPNEGLATFDTGELVPCAKRPELCALFLERGHTSVTQFYETYRYHPVLGRNWVFFEEPVLIIKVGTWGTTKAVERLRITQKEIPQLDETLAKICDAELNSNSKNVDSVVLSSKLLIGNAGTVRFIGHKTPTGVRYTLDSLGVSPFASPNSNDASTFEKTNTGASDVTALRFLPKDSRTLQGCTKLLKQTVSEVLFFTHKTLKNQ